MRCAPTWASRRERQWADRAILRTTPALVGLCSLVTLLAHPSLLSRGPSRLRTDAWYAKGLPTCADALALVRRRWWTSSTFPTSPCAHDLVKVCPVPPALVDHLTDLLCYAA